MCYRSGSFDSEGLKAYIWSSVEIPDVEDESAYAVFFGSDGQVSFKNSSKNNGHSVRCVKD